MAFVPPVRRGFFPLDQELALLPGHLTPQLQEHLTHLGSWIPFEKAAALLQRLTGGTASEPTARRQTLAAGAAYVAVQTAEAEQIAATFPPPPPGPAKQLLAVDGAFVSLVGGEWTEVKTLVLGEVGEPVWEQDEWGVHSAQLSYFSRRADAERFGQQALVEVHRRGTERAGLVAAVTDGAEWEQGFIDLHRADAVRILDFPHARQRLAAISQLLWGGGTPAAAAWEAERARQLKEEGPDRLVTELRQLQQEHGELSELAEHVAYLAKRERHMQYPAYRAAGLPIGSGAVESGNKLVVEARLKGAGMHWAAAHLDPMLGLRNVVCSDRWAAAWPQMVRQRQRAAAAPVRRRAEPPRVAASAVGQAEPAVASRAPAAVPAPAGQPARRPAEPAVAPSAPRRPAANHPWRRYPIRWTREPTASDSHGAKS